MSPSVPLKWDISPKGKLILGQLGDLSLTEEY
jgi:hypothetical protein